MSDWLWDRVLIPFVRHVPGWVVAATALALYPGIGLAVPLLLRWPTPWLVDTNVLGVTAAAVVGVGWLAVQLEASRRRQLMDWTSNLRLLDSAEFEWLVGEVFRREGWAVEETGRQDGPDGNIDLVLVRGSIRKIVQCKRWTARQVRVEDIRAFGGTLMRERLEGRRGVFVTLSTFTKGAATEAAASGIELLNGRDLYERIERVRRAEPCPTCGSPMRLGHSEHGWWLRCVNGDCRGKRDLGSDPGRAAEFLTAGPQA